MYVNRIRVQNFRSIKDTGWVDIESDVTTLLGKNESGKTAFLEAIEGFSGDADYESRDIRESDDMPKSILPVCSVEFGLEQEDRERLAKVDKNLEKLDRLPVTKFAGQKKAVDAISVDYAIPRAIVNVDLTIDIINDLMDKIQERDVKQSAIEGAQQTRSNLQNTDDVSNVVSLVQQFKQEASECIKQIDESAPENREVLNLYNYLFSEGDSITDGKFPAAKILSHLPPIFYHNEADLLKDEIPMQAIEKDEYATFRNLLTEVVGLDLDEFQRKSQMEQFREMDDVNSIITGEVSELWSQKEVEVKIQFDGDTFYTFIKDVGLEDEEIDREPRNPSQRSQGFQWFLSFYINLSAVAESNGEHVVMLLDDPAVFLHPEGKKNWLTAIESIAEDNQVVYTSHSPYLIRKEYPSRIRIVEDKQGVGTQIAEEFADSSSTALAPLREALGIGLGDSPFVSQRKILVEGPSDYYILNGLANYSAEHIASDILGRSDVTILPTGGGDEMVWAAKWVKSEEFSYAILLDNDQKGRNVEDRMKEEASELNEDRIVKLTKEDDHRDYNIEVEDMFPPEFYIDCLNTVYGEEFSWYDPISIERVGDTWQIEGEEHNGRKILNRVEEIFDDRGYGDPDKVLVAKEIEERLNKDWNISPEDISDFNNVLGRIRGAL